MHISLYGDVRFRNAGAAAGLEDIEDLFHA
jgi:hypothetical protein